MTELLGRFNPVVDVVDILVVAYIIYRLLLMVRGTRTVQTLVGFAVIFVGYALIELLELNTSSWLLRNMFRDLPLIIIILFQDEIRSALSRIGRGGWFYVTGIDDNQRIVDETVKATTELAAQRTGALIVFERKDGLADFAERAEEVDSRLSAPFLIGLFHPRHPLHDGAVIVRAGRIAAAAALLPLSDQQAPGYFGTRHRAALGLSERSDAVIVTVSEERGEVSIFVDGAFEENLKPDELRQRLYSLLGIRKKVA